MSKIRYIELLEKKNSGEITLLEQKELNELISQNEIFRTSKKILESFSEKPSKFNKHENFDVEEQLKTLNCKIDNPGKNNSEKPVRRLNLKWLVAASIVFFIFSGGIYFLKFAINETKQENNIVSTKKGSKSTIVLPDGSKVWVNADTKLSYDKSFGLQDRIVELEGEAYFDVIKDKTRTFIVRTKMMDIKVLGTAFNVRSYANEPDFEATLIRGLIEVVLKRKNHEKLFLKPNQKITLRNYDLKPSEQANYIPDIPEISLTTLRRNSIDSTITETQWINNRLVFDNIKFKNAIPLLERWYGVKIEVKNNQELLLGKNLRGIYENESVSEVLESISLALGFTYKIENNTIKID